MTEKEKKVNVQIGSLLTLKFEVTLISVGLVVAVVLAIFGFGSSMKTKTENKGINPNPIAFQEVQVLVDSSTSTLDFIQQLDIKYDQGWSTVGGAWSQGQQPVLMGPAIFWSDLGSGVNTGGLQRISTQGNWGVFFIPEGITYSIPASSKGGRWVKLSE